jgi:leader peptidase (prepilin peptidase)/N-methyltransferase
MQYIYLIFSFLLGLVLASFLNAQMYRWQKEFKLKKLLTQPSQCEKCGKKLKWYELIPVISYIFQKGVCGKCKTKISIYHPISELFLGISFVTLYCTQAPWYIYVVLCFLFMMSYWDYTVMGFPRILAHLLISFTCMTYFVRYLENGYLFVFESGLIPGIIFSLVFLLMNLFYKKKKAFGMGDMFVILAVCMTLTWRQSIMFVFLSVICASIYGVMYAIKNKRDLKFHVPFVIFLTIGFVLTQGFSLEFPFV